MRKYGYGRVSEKDQNEDRQLTTLREQGIPEEYIFIDEDSGKNFDRPEYQLLKRVMREGDTLFVKSINRFGRNKQEYSKRMAMVDRCENPCCGDRHTHSGYTQV